MKLLISASKQERALHGTPGSKLRDVAHSTKSTAFTLLEVMIASGILFVCLFAILGLLANVLRNARALQRAPVDAGMLAAELSLTNKLAEGTDSGDFKEFGDAYRDYHWTSEIFEAETNGLYAVDFVVFRRGHERTPESRMTILLFRPESAARPGRLR